MIEVNLDLWILIICIVLPSLCLITTMYFIFKRGGKLPVEQNLYRNKGNKHEFEDEIAFQVACQELDALLLQTMKDIEKQRQFLQGYLEKKSKANFKISRTAPVDQKENFGDLFKGVEKNIKIVQGSGRQFVNSKNDDKLEGSSVDSNYNGIADMFKSGMASKQIAEKLGIPKSEADLYIKLHLENDQVVETPASSSLLRLSV